MAEISKQALIVENNTSFPNNNNGEISPSDLRSFNVDMIDSTVNQTTYTSNSASWNASIDALEQFTSSQQPSFTALNQFTASQIGINSALTGFTSSADARLDALELETTALESFTASINQIQERGVIKGISTRLNFGGGAFVTASIVANVGGAIADIIINSDTTKTGTGSFNAFTQSYLNDSASFDSRIDSLESFSSSLDVTYVTQAELASATGALEDSIDTKLNTSSFNSYTQSNDDKVNSLIAFTSSVLSIAALVPLNNFTASIAGTNAFTASTNTFTASIAGTNAFTQSAAVSIAALNAATSSYAISSSVAAVDAAQQTQINNLTSATSSYVTESETGSFARTNVDNNFSANQTFTNITAVSASFTYVQTTYETSSVIYSSGSNQLGDELTDTQILSGSVKVVGGLTLNGVNVITSADTASYINTALNAFSASTNLFTASIAGTNAFTQSANGRLNSLEAATASFATTGSNIFRGDEIFSGNIEVRDNIFAGYVDMRDDGGIFLRATGSHYTPGIGEFWSIASQFQIGDLVFVQQPSNDKVISLGLDNRYLSIYKGIKSAGGADFGWDVGQYPLTISSSFGGATDLFNVLGNISASNLHLTGGLTASLQQGYVWVGDSNNKTVLVPTSSFATDISALNTFTASIADTNAFTASATLRLNSLETTSASVNTSIASLNSATSSYAISASVAAVDLAQQNQINVLIAATGSYATTSSLNAYTQSNDARVNSLEAKTGSYATTGSNAFIGNQTITGVLSISSSAAFDLDITGGFKATAASQISGSQATLSLSQLSVQVSGSLGNNVMGRGYYDASINTNKIAIYASGSSTLGGFTAAPLGTCGIAIQSGSVLTNYYYPIQFQGSTQYTDGRVTIATPLSASAGLTIQSGSAFFANGNRQFNIGAFSSLVSQSGSANVSQSMNFETTDISSGVSIASNSRITLANSGTYNIQFSAQLLADTGADDVYIWLKKNGTNVAASAGHVALANNEELIAAWNYVVDAVANDYYELAWQSANGDAILLTEVASGNIPSIPSVILTVTQVR